MPDLQAPVGELHGTITVTRAATGKVETFKIVGKVNHEQAEALGLNPQSKQENQDDTGTQHHGA